MLVLDGWVMANVAIKLVLYSASLLAVGSTLFAIAFRGLNDALLSRLRLGVLIGAIAASVATGLQLMAQAGVLAGVGLVGMMDSEMLSLLWETQAGDAAFVRWIGLALLVVVLISPPILFRVVGAVAAFIVALSFSLVGHAQADPNSIVAPAIVLHVIALSFWAGAFWPLRAAALGATSIADAAELSDKFGRIAVWVVGGLALVGAVAALQLLGGVEALLSSDYGRTLLVKLLLVGAVLILAATNKLSIVPAMQAGDVGSARRLVRSIDLEITAFLAVLATTAVLTSAVSLPG